ncbi:DUF4362 domain-containing protein [Bacillus solitudinis]|uniref:DUF4362 domain-containing protein n=1 Tax=Bacillus solitudinis TaxID=2014074 RepID=UPI000C2471B4|nr:DUF4362 domain-containing protein [Bacillus solitudinis]
MNKMYFLILIFSLLATCNQFSIKKQMAPTKQTVPYQPSAEDVVDRHGELTNLERLDEFISNTRTGTVDEVRLVSYTTEGDAMLHDLSYDGKQIHSTTDYTRDPYGSGRIETVTCQGLDVAETTQNLRYVLTGCFEHSMDNSILQIEK